MTIGPQTQCFRCKHFIFDGDAPVGAPNRCTAFPQRIPDDIIIGGFDHRKEYPGDQGVRYEPIEQPADQATAT